MRIYLKKNLTVNRLILNGQQHVQRERVYQNQTLIVVLLQVDQEVLLEEREVGSLLAVEVFLDLARAHLVEEEEEVADLYLALLVDLDLDLDLVVVVVIVLLIEKVAVDVVEGMEMIEEREEAVEEIEEIALVIVLVTVEDVVVIEVEIEREREGEIEIEIVKRSIEAEVGGEKDHLIVKVIEEEGEIRVEVLEGHLSLVLSLALHAVLEHQHLVLDHLNHQGEREVFLPLKKRLLLLHLIHLL